jgi:hypothetical protein
MPRVMSSYEYAHTQPHKSGKEQKRTGTIIISYIPTDLPLTPPYQRRALDNMLDAAFLQLIRTSKPYLNRCCTCLCHLWAMLAMIGVNWQAAKT